MGFRKAFVTGLAMLTFAGAAYAQTQFKVQQPYQLTKAELSHEKIGDIVGDTEGFECVRLYTKEGTGYLRFISKEETKDVALPDEESDRLIAYVKLHNDKQRRQNQRNWSNSGSAGYAVGSGLQVEVRHTVDPDYTLEARLGTKAQDVSVSEGNTKFSVGHGEDINDEEYTSASVSRMSSDDYFSLGTRHETLDASYVKAMDQMGLLFDYDGEPGVLVSAGFGQGKKYHLEELAAYDRLRASGNHPGYTDEISAAFKGGVSGDNLMGEVTAFLPHLTLFGGAGTEWHNNDPHVGFGIHIKGLPSVSVSFSAEEEFLDIHLPRYQLKNNLEDFQ
ncbi:MAG: hypothetical protein R6V53_03610 [Candidatus Woesearchaeota archaeon]